MSIAKGTTWGVAQEFLPGTPIANSNIELRRLVMAGESLIGLTGGDLFRTIGGATAGDRIHRNDPDNLPMHLPVDLIEVQLDESKNEQFVSHLVGHDRLWRTIVAAMNVDFWRRYQLGPRAHPGDGVVDVYSALVSPAELLKIAPRAKTGTHVPHPAISLLRSAQPDLTLRRRVSFRADDEPIGRAMRLQFRVIPDAVTVVV
jgi:YegS C-terminal NAD kinase beta sandwich-like domain